MKKINFRNRSTWIIMVSIITVVGLISYAYSALHLAYSAKDRKIAHDLAVLSGLSEDDVFSLYDAKGDWEPVKENIFVYKKILNDVKKDWFSGRKAFALISTYSPSDILAVDEFLFNYGADYSPMEDYLKEHSAGKNLENLFALAVTSKAYMTYQPADKDQIRHWLESGYLPQDIIDADSIAIAKDMQVRDILAMKTSGTQWEAIAVSLEYDLKSEDSLVSLTLPSDTEPMTATDYATMVKTANSKTEQNKHVTEEKTVRDLGITSEQMEEYKNRGFTVHDIQNAYRLADQTGSPVEQILQEREQGRDWKDIITDHSQVGTVSYE